MIKLTEVIERNEFEKARGELTQTRDVYINPAHIQLITSRTDDLKAPGCYVFCDPQLALKGNCLSVSQSAEQVAYMINCLR